MTWVENSVIKRIKPDMISSSSVMAWQEKKLGPVWFCLQMPIILYLFVWLLVLNTCGAIRQEKKIRSLIHWNTFKSMKSVGLYFSLCFASDSCYCNISYATVIMHDFKKILISDILLLNLTISLQGERNAQVNYKLLTTMAKKYWLLFEEKRNLKVPRKTG